jgi:hypothetical protein
MGEGFGALLEVWGTPLGPFSESFEFKKKMELVEISIQMQIYAIRGELVCCHWLLVNQFLDKIKKEMSFIEKEGGHYKEEADCP